MFTGNMASRRVVAIVPARGLRLAALLSGLTIFGVLGVTMPAAEPLPPVPNSTAKTEKEMKPYTEKINNTNVTFDMVPIPGGKFVMGSPEDEEGRKPTEGPQREVTIAPFWMGKHEVTWDEFEIFMFGMDCEQRKSKKLRPSEQDLVADTIIRPTGVYTDMSFGMGKSGYPAICMTQFAARMYCIWLSAKTGHYYRLPTEAEWEYACRAGTTSAYSFSDRKKINDYAVHSQDPYEGKYAKVGTKKSNPWGLYDMHGNVNEWCLDLLVEDSYTKFVGQDAINPIVLPTKTYPNVVRGGAWSDPPSELRSAVRRGSDIMWKQQDPCIPQSGWYHTDAVFSGFRVVRPLKVPSEAEKKQIWDVGLEISGKDAKPQFPCKD